MKTNKDSRKRWIRIEIIGLALVVIFFLKNIGVDENQILALITLNGAKVLGIEESTGSLEVGKKS